MKGFAYIIETLGLVILAPLARTLRKFGWTPRRISIIGWWGSETIGDVAILGQLLSECREIAPGLPVTVVSFDTGKTARTLASLSAADTGLCATGLRSAWALATSRCVIFGGGPLMESPSMIVWSWEARLIRASGAHLLCYANGIGPVRSARTRTAILSLIRASTHVVLRDDASREWLAASEPRAAATVAFDPAFDFFRNRLVKSSRQAPYLALALRTPPASYLNQVSTLPAEERFLEAVAGALNTLARAHPMPLVGVVMHDGADGNDHAVYDRLRAKLERPDLLSVHPGHHSVDDAIRDIGSASAALTVRFHAMILALATGTPFIAVDYARPAGKVSGAAAMVGRDGDVMTWDNVQSDELAARLRQLLNGDRATVPDLSAARNRRMAVLSEALLP